MPKVHVDLACFLDFIHQLVRHFHNARERPGNFGKAYHSYAGGHGWKFLQRGRRSAESEDLSVGGRAK